MSSVSYVGRFKLAVSAFTVTLLLAAISLVLADVTYKYNPDGRLTQVCNGSGQAAIYGYDGDGNITSVIPCSCGNCPTPTATATPLLPEVQ